MYNRKSYALAYYNLGFNVIPLHSVDEDGRCSCGKDECLKPGNHPRLSRIKDYFMERPTLEDVKQWWANWPDANIGLIIGRASRVCFLRVKGTDGIMTLAEKLRQIPKTAAMTIGDDLGYFFEYPAEWDGNGMNSGKNYGSESYEMVFSNGFVLIPPSKTVRGEDQKWKADLMTTRLELPPPWVLIPQGDIKEENQQNNNDHPDTDELSQNRQEDKRAQELLLRACMCIENGDPDDLVLEMIRQVDQHINNNDAYDEATLLGIVKAAKKRVAAKKNQKPWFEKSPTGKKTHYRPYILAEHLRESRKILYQNNAFYVYSNGYYKETSRSAISNWAFENMEKEKATPALANQLMDLLAIICTREVENPKSFLAKLESDEQVLNFRNGLYDIGSRAFSEHRSSFLSFVQINGKYDPEAEAPRFLKYLSQATLPGTQLLIQEIAGYLMTPSIRAKKFFMLYGPKNSGKSTFIRTMERILGEENCSHISLAQLNHRFLLPGLQHKLLNSVGDIANVPLKDAGNLKALTGGDMITADQKFMQPFSFMCKAKIMMSCNELPEIKDDAARNRMIVVSFPNSFPEESREDLDAIFEDEYDGIIAWAIEGLHRLIDQNDCFSIPPESKHLMWNRYEGPEASIRAFVEDRLLESPGAQTRVEHVYEAYTIWCVEQGLSPVTKTKFVMTTNSFSNLLRRKNRERQSCYLDVAMVPVDSSSQAG